MPCREHGSCLEHIPACLQVLQDEPNELPGWDKWTDVLSYGNRLCFMQTQGNRWCAGHKAMRSSSSRVEMEMLQPFFCLVARVASASRRTIPMACVLCRLLPPAVEMSFTLQLGPRMKV